MPNIPIDRRSFIAAGAAAAAVPALSATARQPIPSDRPVVISSGNGLRAVDEAYHRIRRGADPLDAVVAGVGIVEDDPNDMSVGLGGLPNERGVVQLDASVMHGPTHKAGAVAALENVRNAAAVALKVMKRTDHVLLVGPGALEFARAHGFPEENLLTDKARRAWLRWKENLNPADDWLDDEQHVAPDSKQAARAPGAVDFTWGTIHCAGLDGRGAVGACTTTSGLSWKLPGRVGDSPIIGAGMFVDNAIGAAGATGRGESAIQSCAAFQVVQRMGAGAEPREACLDVLKWVADHTRRPALRNDRGEPNFNLVLYALRADGAHGAACMRKARSYAVQDGTGAVLRPCGFLYE
jgi:N4-(beta-N-acetylglucosaminyl)-L-asparaginase